MTAEVGAGLYVVTVRVFCVRAAEFVLRGERPQKPWASEMGSPKCFPAYQPPSAWFVSDKTFRLCPEREIQGWHLTWHYRRVPAPLTPTSGFLSLPLSPWMSMCCPLPAQRGERQEQVRCLCPELAVLDVNPRVLLGYLCKLAQVM